MKISFNKLVIIVITIILVIAIIIGIIFSVNNNNNKNKGTTSTIVSKDESSSKYDGSKELGKKIEFDFKEPNITLPEQVKREECKVGKLTWNYGIDKDGNAIDIYVYGENFSGDLVIPSELKGHKVISIGKRENILFNTLVTKPIKTENITSITVPDGVKYINKQAFYQCNNLKKITLPDSIIYIGDSAFGATASLAFINSDIEGKAVMPKNLQYYGKGIFEYNDKISSFEFPKQINYIKEWTFYNTEGFKDLVISGQFEYIGESAFSTSTIETLKIEDGVKIIGIGAFEMNKELKKVDISSSVVSMETLSFQLCTKLSEFKYNGKLKYIGKDVFQYVKKQDPIKNSQLP